MSDGLDEGARIGAIVGGVLCGLLLIAILLLAIVICYRRKKKAQQQQDVYNSAVPVAHCADHINASTPTRKSDTQTDTQTDARSPHRAQHHVPHNARNSVQLSPSPYPTANGRQVLGNTYENPYTVEMRPIDSSQRSERATNPPRQTQSAPQAGIDNPVFYSENYPGNIDTSFTRAERRRNRMDHLSAAAIAAERDRNTSVFNITDTESNADDTESVIVFDHRTAL